MIIFYAKLLSKKAILIYMATSSKYQLQFHAFFGI